jgi:hypothetical protein
MQPDWPSGNERVKWISASDAKQKLERRAISRLKRVEILPLFPSRLRPLLEHQFDGSGGRMRRRWRRLRKKSFKRHDRYGNSALRQFQHTQSHTAQEPGGPMERRGNLFGDNAARL